MRLPALFLVLILVLCSCACRGDANRRVVLVIAANTSIRDVTQPGFNNISHLFNTGSAALMNVHTGRGGKDILPAPKSGMEPGCVSLGAGAMAVGGLEVRQAANTRGSVNGIGASSLYRFSTGLDHGPAEVLHTRISRIGRANSSASHRAVPGTLGSTLQAAGFRTAVVGNSDIPGEIHREAVAAAMNTVGTVDFGDVSSPRLTIRDPQAPFGLKTDTDNLLMAVDRVLPKAEFAVIDFGDTFRADIFSELSTDDHAAVLRYQAALRLDAFIGSLLTRLDFRRDTLILLSPSSRSWSDLERERLTYAIIRGPDFPRGILTSPSTRQLGVVTLNDMAPTVLTILGVEIPSHMIGRPVTCLPGLSASSNLVSMNLDAGLQGHRLIAMRWGSIAQSVIVLLVSLMVLIGTSESVKRVAGWAALLPVCLPLGMLLMPLYYSGGLWGAIAIVAVSAGVLLSACIRMLGHPLRALAWLCGALVAVLVTDMFLGAPLTSRSIAGYSLTEGARYYGIGNELMGTLLGTTLVLTGLALPKGWRTDALTVILFAAVFLTIGLPMLGANLGGAIAGLPAMAVAIMVRRGWRPNVRGLVLVGLISLAVIAALFLLDSLRSGAAQSHMGRVLDRTADGGALGLLAVMQRKLALNTTLLLVSPWSRLMGLSVLSSCVLFIWATQSVGRGLLSHAERAAALGACVGVAGALAFNDSGVVASATCSVVLWALIALRSLTPYCSERKPEGRLKTGPPV